jgi:hypothetical protein
MIDLGRVCRNKRHSKNASRSPLFVWCRPVLDVLPASIEFYNSVGKSGARVYQANTATNAFENDTTHFNDAGARQPCCFIMESLLHSTNSSLVPLQKAVNRQRVRSQAAR